MHLGGETGYFRQKSLYEMDVHLQKTKKPFVGATRRAPRRERFGGKANPEKEQSNA